MQLFSTRESEYLAASLAESLGLPFGQVHRSTFKDGEAYYRLAVDSPAAFLDEDVIIVGATHTDAALLELYRLGVTAAQLGARRRLFVIPFLGYSTMERAVQPGEVVTAKTNMQLLSSIPTTGEGNYFYFLDLHEPSLVHYLEGVPAFELSALDLLAEAVRELPIGKAPVVGSTDLGMPLIVKRLAQQLETDVVLISKSRQFETTAVITCVGNVKNKTVVLYDDMVRSGSSLLNAAQAYTEAGATAIYALVSHFALTDARFVEELADSPILHLITTNSHPQSQLEAVRQSEQITVVDCVGVLGEGLK